MSLAAPNSPAARLSIWPSLPGSRSPRMLNFARVNHSELSKRARAQPQ
jgi:hypothetical protein